MSDKVSRYDNMSIIKTANQEVKLFFIHIKDIAIILAGMGSVFIMNKILGLPFIYFLIQELIVFIFCIFLCFKSSNNGGDRNIKVIARLFKMDNNVYRFQKIIENTERRMDNEVEADY